eukprot:TRINITY_DN9288_c0_g1_i3.p1 TRINITY_DN9288_c0_g1~~TRINITY_DN9288_c0_g1_i3.p1  ORF type:complete len:285 (-),score=46.22 TRINITY_DN9288_c0_g1_i3:33-887(-)
MKVSVKNTFVSGFVDEDEESEDERISLKRSSSEGELSKHSSRHGSSESSFLFWMPPPEVAEMGSESSSVGGADSSSDFSAQQRASPSQGVPLHRLHARRTSPAFVETSSISAIHGLSGGGQAAEGNSSGSQAGPAYVGQGLQVASSPWVSAGTEPGLSDPHGPDLIALYHEETGLAVSDLERLYQTGALQMIPRNDEGGATSVGSLKHAAKQCVPCIFWFRGICTKSLLCTYCHFKHPGQKAKRHKPNKRTRQLIREAKSAEQASAAAAAAAGGNESESGGEEI